MNNAITILEGSSALQFIPEFDGWALALAGDANRQFALARADLRVNNGPELITRCQDTWAARQPMFLKWTSPLGAHSQHEIAGIRLWNWGWQGDVLTVWVKFKLLPYLIE